MGIGPRRAIMNIIFSLSFLMRFILRPDSFKTETLLPIEWRLQIARYSTWKGARLIDSPGVCVCVCPVLTTPRSCMHVDLAKAGISGPPYLQKGEPNLHAFNHVHLWSRLMGTPATELTKKLPRFPERATRPAGCAHTCTAHRHAGVHAGCERVN